MDDTPELLRFAPVPGRAQHNGWTPERQRAFILALARGAGPGAAARSVGMGRQSAYRLRARPGAQDFAAAWDRAVAFAGDVRAAPAPPGPGFGIDTLLVPRFYRGRLVGFVVREDIQGAMRLLGRLDRMAERLDLDRLGSVKNPARSDRSDRISVANAPTSSLPGDSCQPA